MSDIVLIILGAAVLSAAIWAAGVWSWSLRRRGDAGKHPCISILVAARNEEHYLEACLEALLRLDYPKDLTQIVVVDDRSTDQTRAVAEALAARCPGRITVLSAPPCPTGWGPKKHALTYAIGQATGDILLFTDADCVVPAGWASAMVREFDDSITGAVASAVLPPRGISFGDRLYSLERLLVSYTSAAAIGLGVPGTVSGGSFAYRRSIFAELGGFAHPEVASGDDDLMAQAIARRGWKVRFAPGASAVVLDTRRPDWHRQVHASIRHQSTVRFYPKFVRGLYLLTIVSGIGSGLALLSIPWLPALAAGILGALGIRLLVEGSAVLRFTGRLGHRLTLVEFLMAELCLPLYLFVRPILALGPKFVWQGRMHTATPTPDPLS